MREARKSRRRRVLKGAISAFNLRHSTIRCCVRDMSDTGCRLLSDGSIAIPDTFTLIIELDGFEAECEVVWRTADEVGVRFTSAPKITKPKRIQVLKPTRAPTRPTVRRKAVKGPMPR
jgi:PilZ domain